MSFGKCQQKSLKYTFKVSFLVICRAIRCFLCCKGCLFMLQKDTFYVSISGFCRTFLYGEAS